MEQDSRSGAPEVLGIPVAAPASMARRIMAMLAMVVLIGLLLILVWRVYLHHEFGSPAGEPVVVSAGSAAA